MYTGIIQTQGEITAVRPARAGGKLFQVRVNEPDYFSDVKIGDSVNLDGVCFTAIERTADSITVEAMPETLRLTLKSHYSIMARLVAIFYSVMLTAWLR